MGLDEGAVMVRVSVAYSPAAWAVDETELMLVAGSTVADALAASGLQARHPGIDLGAASIGVWGALCERTQVLRDRDRVEVYRALRVDPKEARRQRYKDQRGAGGKRLSR
jgi:hypothetical protein